jgi:hypothetical protein
MTRPSSFNARLWTTPAAIAVTPLEAAAGTLHTSAEPPPQPQATTAPVAAACAAPAPAVKSSPTLSTANTQSRRGALGLVDKWIPLLSPPA